MAGDHRFCLCQHHMVILLIQRFLRIGGAGWQRTNHIALEDHHVLFVDGQPVLNLTTIVLKAGDGKTLKGRHCTP